MEKLSITSLAEMVPDEEAAYKLLEEWRWGDRPFCPHCGSVRAPYFLTPKATEGRQTRRGQATHRRVWKCADCRKQFAVNTNTLMHGSHIPERKWLFVMFEMASDKNGIAAREIERNYDLTPKSARFMTQRVREAMRRDPMAGLLRGTIVMSEPKPKAERDQPTKIPLDPVEAIKAILQVDPRSDPVEDDETRNPPRRASASRVSGGSSPDAASQVTRSATPGPSNAGRDLSYRSSGLHRLGHNERQTSLDTPGLGIGAVP